MRLRVGVDVGGTFTKAVAVDPATGAVRHVRTVPTTHDAPGGVADGVVTVLAALAEAVGAAQLGAVTWSTTQAVNALLEGDVATVGVLGLGSRPDLGKARRRTRLHDVELVAGRRLPVVGEFLDVTDGLDPQDLAAALDRLQGAGAGAVAVAEAFAPDRGAAERAAVRAATARGLPACGSTDLVGMYGLELRTVTAAVNAAILPVATATADTVQRGAHAAGLPGPLLVMRGDGGATDLAGFRQEPARSLYSGPAASVAGVLRALAPLEAVVVEVGGTSTNVAAIAAGQPALAQVRVGSHATALRALDVRVAPVAGGSLLRARRGRRRVRLYGVGPRSAHIAGLGYACFHPRPEDLADAVPELVAPRPGDPADYVVLRCPDGTRVGVTVTCAANAVGLPQPGDHAAGSPAAALAACAAAGRLLGLPGPEVARRMLAAAGAAVAELAAGVAAERRLTTPPLVAVGGGAGGLGRHVAALLGLTCVVPPHAAVVSSVGDALSLLRVERTQATVTPTPDLVRAVAAAAEAEALGAGASPGSVDVRVEHDPTTALLRAVAVGWAAERPPTSTTGPAEAARIAAAAGCDRPVPVGAFFVATAPGPPGDAAPRRVVVVDGLGEVALQTTGVAVLLQPGRTDTDPPADTLRDRLGPLVDRLTLRRAGSSVPPRLWTVAGNRLAEVAPGDVAAAVELATDTPAGSGGPASGTIAVVVAT